MPADLRAEALALCEAVNRMHLAISELGLATKAQALRARLAESRGYANRHGWSASEEPSAPAPARQHDALCPASQTYTGNLGSDPSVPCTCPPPSAPGIPALAEVMGLPATVPMTNADHTTPSGALGEGDNPYDDPSAPLDPMTEYADDMGAPADFVSAAAPQPEEVRPTATADRNVSGVPVVSGAVSAPAPAPLVTDEEVARELGDFTLGPPGATWALRCVRAVRAAEARARKEGT